MGDGFLKDIAKYLPAQIVPGIVGLISMPVVTRIFPPAEYGHYNLVMATVMVLSTVFGWLPTSITRYYPTYARQEQQLEVFKATVTSLGVVALIVLCALYYVALLVLGAWMSATLWSLLMIGGLLFAVTCAFNLFQSILRSKRFVGRYSAFAVWQSVAGFGLGIAMILLLGLRVEGLLLGATFSIVPILPLLWRAAMDAGVRIRLDRTDLKIAKTMFFYGLPLMVGNLAAWVLSLSDRYVLGLLRGTSEVGLYSLSYNIADRSIMLLATLFLMAEPAIGVRIWENQGEADSQRFVANVARLYLLLCIPVAVGLSVVSKLVVRLLGGEEYAEGYRIVPFVLFGVVLLGLQQRFHWGLLYHQKTGPITVALVVAGLLKVLLNILFVPRYGYFAAAVTTLICYAVSMCLIIWFSRRLYVWRFPYRSLLKIAVASAIMGVVVHYFERASILAPVLRLLVCMGVGAVVYAAVLLALREFSSQEIGAVRQAVSRAIATLQPDKTM
jgi:O-antigen/teichoic acid export membrane protein